MEHEESAERMESGADDMEQRRDELDREISETREDWDRKKHDQQVPGAQPSAEEIGDEEAERETTAETDEGRREPDHDEDEPGGE